MTRLAGDSKHYQIGFANAKGKLVGDTYPFVSVTSVLDVLSKPGLPYWYLNVAMDGMETLYKKYGSNMPHDAESLKSLLSTEKLHPRDIRDFAADTGKDIHAQLERLSQGGDVEPAVHEGLAAWWVERGITKERIIAAEVPVVSFKWRFAGTLDLVYTDPIDGSTVLADLKTGKSIQDNHFVQGHAYKLAWEEQGGVPIDHVRVIHVRPKGLKKDNCLPKGWEELECPRASVDLFFAALEIYKATETPWRKVKVSI